MVLRFVEQPPCAVRRGVFCARDIDLVQTILSALGLCQTTSMNPDMMSCEVDEAILELKGSFYIGRRPHGQT